MLDPFALCLIAAAFLLAGFVKGVIGLGLPTVSIGLLSLVMVPTQAASMLLVPSMVTNVWQLVGPKFRPLLARLRTMMIGIGVGAVGSAIFLPDDTSGWATFSLGAVLVVYALLGLLSVRFSVSPRTERWLAPLIGVATGVMTSLTGVFVIPALPYLQSLGFDRDDLVQALGIHFTLSTVALTVVLAIKGVLQAAVSDGSLIVTSLAALVPALIGMYVGQAVRHRISARLFRVCFFVGMLALGANLALRHFI